MEYTEAEEDDEELELVVDKILNQDTFSNILQDFTVCLSIILIFAS